MLFLFPLFLCTLAWWYTSVLKNPWRAHGSPSASIWQTCEKLGSLLSQKSVHFYMIKLFSWACDLKQRDCTRSIKDSKSQRLSSAHRYHKIEAILRTCVLLSRIYPRICKACSSTALSCKERSRFLLVCRLPKGIWEAERAANTSFCSCISMFWRR